MALSSYDQSVYDAGYKFIPQSQYLLDPFQIPAGSENTIPTGIATTYQAQNMGGGGGGFNPYNADMSQIRTDFRPDYDFRAYQDFGVTNPDQLTTAQRKEMDMNQEYYYDRPSAMQQKIGGLMNFIPGIGTLKRGAEFIGGFLKDKLPINQRAILENQLRGSGVLTDDIGRIVSRPGEYNTPEGIMAGYNAAKMTDATFDKRTGNIAETLEDKYNFDADDIANLNAGIITPEMEQKAYNSTMGKTSNLLTNYININKAKINFNRKQKKADDIVAFKEKQKAFKDAGNARDSDNDGVPDYVEDAGGSYDGGYHGAEGGFENTGGSGGAQLSSGMTTNQHAAFKMADGGRIYFMDGGIVDLVDIYD